MTTAREFTDEEQIILKTVVKQAAKYWSRRERLDAAIDHVNTEGEEGINYAAERQPERDVTPIRMTPEIILSRTGTDTTTIE